MCEERRDELNGSDRRYAFALLQPALIRSHLGKLSQLDVGVSLQCISGLRIICRLVRFHQQRRRDPIYCSASFINSNVSEFERSSKELVINEV